MIHEFVRNAPTAFLRFALIFSFAAFFAGHALGQSSASLKGRVTLGESGQPIHNVLITVLQLKRTVGTDEQGNYEFQNLPPGRYDVIAHLDRVPDIVRSVEISWRHNGYAGFPGRAWRPTRGSDRYCNGHRAISIQLNPVS